MILVPQMRRGRASGGGAWSPASLGSAARAWFDATNPESAILSGSNVLAFNDLSGNGFNYVAPFGVTYDNVLGGSIRIGTGQYRELIDNTLYFESPTQFGLWVSGVYHGSVGTNPGLLRSSAGVPFYIFRGEARAPWIRGCNGSDLLIDTDSMFPSDTDIAIGYYSGAEATEFYYDGVAVVTGAASICATTWYAPIFGSQYGREEYVDFSVHKLLFTTDVLSSVDIANITGWLLS